MVILTNAKRFSNRNVITWWILKSAKDDLSRILTHAVLQCTTFSSSSDGCQFFLSWLLKPYKEDAYGLLSVILVVWLILPFLQEQIPPVYFMHKCNSHYNVHVQYTISDCIFSLQYSVLSLIKFVCYQLHICVTHPEIIFQFIHAKLQSGKGVFWPLACHSASMCVYPNRQRW